MIVNTERDPEGQTRISVFRRNFQALGWEEGRNVSNRLSLGRGTLIGPVLLP
jgi:hypothetical protein